MPLTLPSADRPAWLSKRREASDRVVYSEGDLRRAIGDMVRNGQGYAVRIGATFRLTSGIVLPSSIPGASIVGTRGAALYTSSTIATLFSLQGVQQSVRDLFIDVRSGGSVTTVFALTSTEQIVEDVEMQDVANATLFASITGNRSGVSRCDVEAAKLASVTGSESWVRGCRFSRSSTVGTEIVLEGRGIDCVDNRCVSGAMRIADGGGALLQRSRISGNDTNGTTINISTGAGLNVVALNVTNTSTPLPAAQVTATANDVVGLNV